MEANNGDSKSKMEEYEVIEQLGRGAYGASFLVLHKTQKKKYVMKKIRLAKQTNKCKRIAHQEIDLLSKLRNPYILEYKDTWLDMDCCICFITDYCEGADMVKEIKKANGTLFREECSNIFVTKENDIRVGDFGLAKLLSPDAVAMTVDGTPNYMCPELLADVPYGYKSDIWSLGCCIFEIAAQQPAFRAPDKASLINKINRSILSPFPIMYTPMLKQVIKTMLRKHPEHRPPASEVLRHPYLQPFVLQCRNASPVYLPVRSLNSKEKTITKTSPLKSSTSAICEESLETKRVNTIRYNASQSSKCDSSSCQLINVPPNERECEITLLRSISKALGTRVDETKIGVDFTSHKKAEALESLLELCARLLREDQTHSSS